MAIPELRQDPVTGCWVVIAPSRAARPHQIAAPNNSTYGEACPFCAGNEAMTPPEVWALRYTDSEAKTPGWRVRVVTNKYPALDLRGTEASRSKGLYRATTALGVHEVIIESPDHAVNLSVLDAEQFENVLYAYRARWRALIQDRRWRYLMIYKNQGGRAGATLEHVHSQLIALPQVPPQAVVELNGTSKHFAATGRCIYPKKIS
jgi:UDPglucose--hexose-1-phosphate uridylyltransferase